MRDVRAQLASIALMAANLLEHGSDVSSAYWAGVLRELAEDEALTKMSLSGDLRCAADALWTWNRELSGAINALVPRVARVGLYN